MARYFKATIGGAMLLLVSTGAQAAGDFIEGVYLKSEKLCTEAKTSTLQPLIEAGQMVLSSRGFDTIEANCAFMQVTKHPRMEKAWLVTAFCEEPDYASPDVFTFIERTAGQLDVASLAEGATGGVVGDEGGADDGTGAMTDGAGTDGAATDGQAAADANAQFANSGISGTYFRCDGVTML